MRRRGLGFCLVLFAAAGPVAAATARYTDPWDAATVAAAESAVGRLAGKPALEVRGTVLAIRGLAADAQSASHAIVATVQELQRAKKDLGAQETALEIQVDLPADVLFDFDKADIRNDAATALGNLATIIAGYPSASVELGGHTDAKGSAAYNLRLSQRRADAVKEWLVSHGVAATRVTTHGYGATRPVADNATEAGRGRNRRVEAVIHKSAG